MVKGKLAKEDGGPCSTSFLMVLLHLFSVAKLELPPSRSLKTPLSILSSIPHSLLVDINLFKLQSCMQKIISVQTSLLYLRHASSSLHSESLPWVYDQCLVVEGRVGPWVEPWQDQMKHHLSHPRPPVLRTHGKCHHSAATGQTVTDDKPICTKRALWYMLNSWDILHGMWNLSSISCCITCEMSCMYCTV